MAIGNPEDGEQIRTHLKLIGFKLGYPLCFREAPMKDRIDRPISGFGGNLCAPATLREKNGFQSVALLNVKKLGV